jgi:hypothetical protein
MSGFTEPNDPCEIKEDRTLVIQRVVIRTVEPAIYQRRAKVPGHQSVG